ncbi:hypothetical protein PsorP6_009573 [Peronosclerospora sorghi]|uniref:Uncharacterized protein n=1 Tax=Peronosclerospora sorghi TaxID=230839 RepID=A0ACC0W206_9STRA|nr:hypothetical protein PsorP6_009573 [Peronosclerospora sorghi]
MLSRDLNISLLVSPFDKSCPSLLLRKNKRDSHRTAALTRPLCVDTLASFVRYCRDVDGAQCMGLLDMSTYQGVSYLDIRIRLCWQGTIVNIHLVSVPVFERHINENMFNISVKFLDCICREWQKNLVGVATDGARI